MYKHDFICISEIYFESEILERDANFQFDGYEIIRDYHESLSVCVLNLTNQRSRSSTKF